MLIVKLLLYPLIIFYGALAICAFRTARKTFLKYRKYQKFENVQHDPEWQGFIRKDFNNWNEKQILIGSFVRFPLKVMALLLLLGIIFTLIKCGIKPGPLIMWLESFLLSLAIKIDDAGCQLKVKTPIVISNHVSWMDIFYLFTYLQPLSFVAKQEISNMPFFGPAAVKMQCLLVNRESEVARTQILNQIRKRIHNYQNKQDVYPLLVFPEGTTSNGTSILRFKNGAFTTLPPITLFALNYESEGFEMGMDEITPVQHFVISLCLSSKMAVKSALMRAGETESEEQYKLRCQKKMSQLTGFRIYDAGFKQKCLFGKKRRERKEE